MDRKGKWTGEELGKMFAGWEIRETDGKEKSYLGDKQTLTGEGGNPQTTRVQLVFFFFGYKVQLV